MECSATLEMVKERRYVVGELWDRLRIVYGRVDVVRRNINESLATDDRLCRQCGMMEFTKSIQISRSDGNGELNATYVDPVDQQRGKLLCNKLTLIIDQEMNEMLSEF